MKKFVFSQVPEVETWELVRTWANKDFKTYVEYTFLYSNGKRYIYIYIFDFFNQDLYTLEGVYEPSSPRLNDKN